MIVIALLLAISADPDAVYRSARAAYIGTQIFDVSTTVRGIRTFNCHESNQVLSKDGRFTGQSLAIKAGIAGGTLFVAHLMRKQSPKWAAVSLFGASAVTGFIGVRNTQVCKGFQ